MKRFVRNLAILAKSDTTYAVDSGPTGAANAFQVSNVRFTSAATKRGRDLIVAHMGNQGSVLTDQHVMIEFSCELAGSGTAGTAPAMGPLLRACSFAETIVAATSVSYNPVSDPEDSVTIHYAMAGVRHVMLGCRGGVNWELTAQNIPILRFRVLGLKGAIADVPLPTTVYSAWKKAIIVSKANTTVSLHGYAGAIQSLTIDQGARVIPRLLINHESIEISDRPYTGRIVIDAPPLATKNFHAIADARTRGVLSAVHGTVAGNIVTLSADATELDMPEEGNADGILTYTMGMDLCTTAGDDEFSMVFT